MSALRAFGRALPMAMDDRPSRRFSHDFTCCGCAHRERVREVGRKVESARKRREKRWSGCSSLCPCSSCPRSLSFLFVSRARKEDIGTEREEENEPLLIVHAIVLVAVVGTLAWSRSDERTRRKGGYDGRGEALGIDGYRQNFVAAGLGFMLGVFTMFSAFAHLDPEKWQRIFSIVGCLMCMGRGGNSMSSSGFRKDPVEDLEIEQTARERERGEGGMGAIADCFSEIFRADLVPSDISAGLALLAIQD